MSRPPVVWSERYACDIGAHVFPTHKYGLVMAALGGPWHEPPPADRALLALAHDAEYLDDLAALRWTERTARSELPLTREVVDAFSLAASGTTLAARLALERGAAVHVGGGLHHAHAGHAEGFCYVNDLAVAIRALRAEGRARRMAVVDLDVHQGNGTAAIFAGDADVFTFSIHQEANYPVPKAHSDLDVGLADGTGDRDYLAALDGALPAVWAHVPEIVLVQAGADPYREDLLGGLALTFAGLEARDARVLDGCRERGIPAVITLGGGYARDTADTVRIHVATCRRALALARGA